MPPTESKGSYLPCNRIRTVPVVLSALTNIQILKAGLASAGFRVYESNYANALSRFSRPSELFVSKNGQTGYFRGGILEVPLGQEKEWPKQIKIAYALASVKAATSKYGMKLIPHSTLKNTFIAEKAVLGSTQDRITIEVTDTGIIKTQTGRISAANHKTAEEFLSHMSKLAGGKVIETAAGTPITRLQERNVMRIRGF